jgi:hypothetical protein
MSRSSLSSSAHTCAANCTRAFDVTGAFGPVVDEMRRRTLHAICVFIDHAGSYCAFCQQTVAPAEPQGRAEVLHNGERRVLCSHDRCRRGRGVLAVSFELQLMADDIQTAIPRGDERLAAFIESVGTIRLENQVVHMQDMAVWLYRSKEVSAALRSELISRLELLAKVYLMIALDFGKLEREANGEDTRLRRTATLRRVRTITSQVNVSP